MEDSTDALQLKIIVIGEPSVGKTSTIKKYCHGVFDQLYRATIGVDFAVKFEKVDDKEVELRLWDIAGQEKYIAMTRVYYNGAHGAIIMYDVTAPNTFGATDKWKEDLESKVKFNDQPIPALLVGNKADLLSEEEMKTAEKEMRAKVEEQKYADGILTSAKSGLAVEDAMKKITHLIFERFKELSNPAPDPNNVDLSKQKPKDGESSGCC
ncbi:rab17, putative [Entamoeba invadens IP1]|uniref:Ras-related protein Rab n=1 Tax=Entamoeba invadens IP1 TaxID=370355 RepID=A0A0A1U3N4_ENTIV|nr:rab17, putative [Entamoeba invadens IP1]ELP87343.1 rab17, putative [Entamoeba invadens IP1]|eukprot:XP_004254114.1 rab17, putative [Entamoeba invadens IP1]